MHRWQDGSVLAAESAVKPAASTPASAQTSEPEVSSDAPPKSAKSKNKKAGAKGEATVLIDPRVRLVTLSLHLGVTKRLFTACWLNVLVSALISHHAVVKAGSQDPTTLEPDLAAIEKAQVRGLWLTFVVARHGHVSVCSP